MGKADVVSIGGRKLLAASLLVGAGVTSGWASGRAIAPADALELPPISTPPVSVGPVVVSPVQTPPVVVPVPSTVAVGPLIVSTPDASVDPDGGLHVRIPLPSEGGTAPGTVGIDIGPGGSSVSLPPLGGGTIEPVPAPITPIADPTQVADPGAHDAASGPPDAARREPSARERNVIGDAEGGRVDAARSDTGLNPQVLDADPAGAQGSLPDSGRGGFRSLLAAAAHSKVTWLLLLVLAVIARFVVTWAWRDALSARSPTRSRGRSATA
jgi:hypothetical protein